MLIASEAIIALKKREEFAVAYDNNPYYKRIL